MMIYRKIALSVLGGCLLLTGTLAAQPERHNMRAGNRAFYRAEFNEAELEYRRALAIDSTALPVRYNLSNTLEKLSRHEQAQKMMTAVADVLPLERQADAFHNLGNMQLSQKKYGESIASYKQSLRLRPDDMETKTNLAYACKMFREQQDREQQDRQQNQDQNQDKNKDQDQNQDENQNQQQNQDGQQDQQQPQQQPQQPQQQPKISKQAAQQMLEAIQQKEKETQDKVNREKAKVAVPVRSGKNW